ncbi:MAG TPA: Imm42 family immunity protein [Candidatus Angelobacter sp.]|nr:Imm42 family immunity protein [Candidatus Angelobacter sp.]
MMIGDPSIIAIESNITQAYEHLSFRALGYFVIHAGGRRYGTCSPDSTMLACSFDEVGRRIRDRGLHAASFATTEGAGSIADNFRNAFYAEEQKQTYFGLSLHQFSDLIVSKRLVWAPDGDEAFEDSSYVLQFDVQDQVRIIAFKSVGSYFHQPETLSDVWLSADVFLFCSSAMAQFVSGGVALLPKVPLSDYQ